MVFGSFSLLEAYTSSTQDAYALALCSFLSRDLSKMGGGPLILNTIMMCIFPVLHKGQAISDCLFDAWQSNS